MIAGVVLDDWKLPIFRQRLSEAGYTYADAGGLTHNTTVLQIDTDDINALTKVIEACQTECREFKARNPR